MILFGFWNKTQVSSPRRGNRGKCLHLIVVQFLRGTSLRVVEIFDFCRCIHPCKWGFALWIGEFPNYVGQSSSTTELFAGFTHASYLMPTFLLLTRPDFLRVRRATV